MKNSTLLLLGILFLFSCKNDEEEITSNPANPFNQEVCTYKTEIKSPDGFDLNPIGNIDFNGGVRAFQFVDQQIAFAMLTNNVGGYVEVFKTTDGGATWTNLNIGIKQSPKNMIFRDQDFGIISVHDVSGCPPPNRQNKCVLLKTENGGLDWETIAYEGLKGVLYHPKFDEEGNIYANLSFDGEYTLMKSKDNGMTWDTLFSSPMINFSLLSFSFDLLGDQLFVSGEDGKILVVDTNGNLIKTIETGGTSIWDLELIDAENIIAVFSQKVMKSSNGGDTWETIYDETARMIGFDAPDKGLMFLQKSSCPTDTYQVNDLIAATNNGGIDWTEAEETTSNLKLEFSNSQKMMDGSWYFMLGNELFEISEK